MIDGNGYFMIFLGKEIGKEIKKNTNRFLESDAAKNMAISYLKKHGEGVDIHNLIGKIPKPKGGWTRADYKYMGPYNPLDEQLEYNKNTGEVTKWNVKPKNKVDEISAHHDICYDMGKSKGECDQKMVKSLDEIPYGEMHKWGQTARFLINTKQKLGLGVKQKRAPKN